jgi:hypothetical protein
MIYEKEKLPQGHITRQLQRYVNMRAIFENVKSFDDYKKINKKHGTDNQFNYFCSSLFVDSSFSF